MKKAGLLILGAGLISLSAWAMANLNLQPTTSSESSAVGFADWASPAVTIADEVAGADLIVRAKVTNVNQARKLRQVLPRYSSDAKIDGEGVNIMPFTDSEMAVLEVYKGSAEQHITVMQTGGSLPAENGDPAMNLVTYDDPLFVAGSEHILFLADISGDPVHGQGRKLYRAINPAGRYEIQGTTVFSPSEFPAAYKPPKTVDELVSQIKQALARR